MERKRQSLVVWPLLVLVGSIAGGLFGSKVSAAADTTQREDLAQEVASFTRAYALVEDNFAGPVSAGQGHL